MDLRSYDYGRVSCFLVYSRKWVASSFDLIHCVESIPVGSLFLVLFVRRV